MISVIVVSDIRIYCEGLGELLGRDGRIDVVAQAADRGQTIALAIELEPEAVLLDMAMPEAKGLVAQLLAMKPDTNVIALGVSERKSDIVACAESGIRGYVCRNNSIDELVEAVESTVAGKLQCSAAVAAALMQRVADLASRHTDTQLDRLTDREMEVAGLIEQGCSNKQIAARLHIQVSTTKNHVHNVLDKLGVRRRTEAAFQLRRSGLLQPQRVL